MVELEIKRWLVIESEGRRWLSLLSEIQSPSLCNTFKAALSTCYHIRFTILDV